jgi:hypothetical protein
MLERGDPLMLRPSFCVAFSLFGDIRTKRKYTDSFSQVLEFWKEAVPEAEPVVICDDTTGLNLPCRLIEAPESFHHLPSMAWRFYANVLTGHEYCFGGELDSGYNRHVLLRMRDNALSKIKKSILLGPLGDEGWLCANNGVMIYGTPFPEDPEICSEAYRADEWVLFKHLVVPNILQERKDLICLTSRITLPNIECEKGWGQEGNSFGGASSWGNAMWLARGGLIIAELMNRSKSKPQQIYYRRGGTWGMAKIGDHAMSFLHGYAYVVSRTPEKIVLSWNSGGDDETFVKTGDCYRSSYNNLLSDRMVAEE